MDALIAICFFGVLLQNLGTRFDILAIEKELKEIKQMVKELKKEDNNGN